MEHQELEHQEQPTSRFTFGLFVVAELLCTGALIAWIAL
jgi:hypothetical protein